MNHRFVILLMTKRLSVNHEFSNVILKCCGGGPWPQWMKRLNPKNECGQLLSLLLNFLIIHVIVVWNIDLSTKVVLACSLHVCYKYFLLTQSYSTPLAHLFKISQKDDQLHFNLLQKLHSKLFYISQSLAYFIHYTNISANL